MTYVSICINNDGSMFREGLWEIHPSIEATSNKLPLAMFSDIFV